MKKTWSRAVPYIAVLGLFVVLLQNFVSGQNVLLTTDAAIAASDRSFLDMLRMMVPYWSPNPLFGSGSAGGTSVAVCTLGIFPSGILWNNWVHGLGCLIGSIVFIYHFSRKGMSTGSVLLALILAFWIGSNFTLIYAGHPHKPQVVMLFITALIPVRAAAKGSVYSGLLWGGCVGLMFAQQPDIALFFAMFAGAYMVFQLWQVQGWKPLAWLQVLAPAAVLAFLFAAGPLLSGYKHHVKDAVQMQTENKEAKWDYVTQWSFPPDEMIAFVAPGYTGWRSGESEGPYWGRMGRSAGWEETRQGFQNFKLENTYLGILPIAFALFALASCRRSRHRAEILFWGGATLVALLLAFGKFFPLYALFYQLPVVNNIRNPNKFLQVFQVCLAILTLYGVDSLFSQRSKVDGGTSRKAETSSAGSDVYRFFWFTLAALGVLVMWAVTLTFDRAGDTARFLTQGWPKDAAEVIVSNKVAALWHASCMTAVVVAVFAVFALPRFQKLLRFQGLILTLLVFIVAADAVKLSKHYVKEMPRSYIDANPLTEFLKKDLGYQRIALLSQQGLYNLWTTFLLPYNRIPTFNFSDMPRMASDYKMFLEAGQRDPLGMWRFSSVKYLLAPASAEQQLVAANCRKVFAHNVFQVADGGYGVAPDMNGQFAVFEVLGTLPRYTLFAGSRKGSDEAALETISDFRQVMLPVDSSLPELSGTGPIGRVEVLSYRPGKVTLRTRSDVPTILRCADKYDADWTASVGGKAVEVGRVDFICQGVAIPPGYHEVVLRYAPSTRFFYMQVTGYVILLASLGAFLWRRKGSCAAD